MTLYELLHKVSFDEIAPFLSKSYAEGRSLAWFKMHYDYLCHLVPSPKSETGYDIYVPQFGIRIVHKKVGSLTNILYLYR